MCIPFYIFKKSYKQENYFSENITNNTLTVFKRRLPITYSKLA